MERLRRTMMYVPGNNPGMLADAGIYGADSLMFDLEDSVAVAEKDSARFMVFHAVSNFEYGDKEIVVRINGLSSEHGHKDIEAMVKAGVDVIRLPKTDTAQDVHDAESVIAACEKKFGREVGSTRMMAAIESPLGAMNAYQIATASERLIGIAIGAEDYVTSMKTKRSPEGIEILAARSQIVMAARAAGIAALDTVYSDVDNMEGFIEEVKLIKQLGFDGKSVINPRQIDPVHALYAPSKQEINEARQVIFAIIAAEKNGSGVISVNGKMVDKPIVERAERVLELAGIDKEAMLNEAMVS
jgi:citrate lyase subunit beta/citryl-CoA lyase